MEDLIKRQDVYDMLHELGGCGAEKDTWEDGWDKAINASIRELEKISTAYDVDKIKEKLKDELLMAVCENDEICDYPHKFGCCYDKAIKRAIKITNKEEKE